MIKIIIAYDLQDYLVTTPIGKFLFAGAKHLPFTKKGRGLSFGARLRLALQELGPVWIKLGQALSTRTRQLSPLLINELSKLRDECEPFDRYFAERAVKRACKCARLSDVYAYLSFHPEAAGSIAQVHYGILNTGEHVAVKVLRPGIREAVYRDLGDFKTLLKLITIFDSRIKVLDVDSIIDELERAFITEIDLRWEAKNMNKFREVMAQYDILIPHVYDNLCSSDVLVMEYMHGIPLDDLEGLLRNGIDPKHIAQQGLELFMLQVFRHGVYHADPHSGNIWINESGKRIFLDFGLMGYLDSEDKRSLAKLMIFTFTSPKHILSVLKDRGWISNDTDSDKLYDELEDLGKTMAAVKSNRLAMSNVLNTVLNICRQHRCKLPYQYTLLVKTLATLEGNTFKLCPDFDTRYEGSKIIDKHFMDWFK